MARADGGGSTDPLDRKAPPSAPQAEDVLRAHSRQSSPRMSYNGTGYRFLCGSEPGFVVCSVCPTSLSQAAAEEFQRRVTEAFQEYVSATLGSCDAGVIGGVTKAHRFVGFGETPSCSD